ncbi:hypothetical protein [Intrasporangium sp. DVR]|uniref:hypothetical protein n=1 Tax=Intrasporangium sp. DVR TaxID=3127867 RepID=UPI003340F65A
MLIATRRALGPGRPGEPAQRHTASVGGQPRAGVTSLHRSSGTRMLASEEAEP